MNIARYILVIFLLLLMIDSGCFAKRDFLWEDASSALGISSRFFASLSENGGYCGIYSLDLKKRYSEALYEPLDKNHIWIQPPGTPSVGEAFLRCYMATGEEEFLELAKNAGKALAWVQNEDGGWWHFGDVAGLGEEATRFTREKGVSSFDDNTTQGSLAFLIMLDRIIDEPWFDESVHLGLDFLIRS